jgi:hypothetical protein
MTEAAFILPAQGLDAEHSHVGSHSTAQGLNIAYYYKATTSNEQLGELT